MSTSPEPQRHDSALQVAARLEQITERLHAEVARLSGMQASSEPQTELLSLRDELRGMAELIAETRTEVAGLLPACLPHARISSASDELDAVVDATERAAVEIMTAAEHAQESAQRLRAMPGLSPEALADVDVIENATLDIFMACSFQDLTGQRIRKVVQALTYIEKRVLSLTALWEQTVGIAGVEAPVMDNRNDAHLLNGPSASGLAQDDIDSLLQDGGAVEPNSQSDIDALFA
jgi:chemotaxis regulatin CheY-phosphate phosphatase CheZ